MADDRWADFVCLPRSLANHRVLRMSGEAIVISLDIKARAEAAAAQNNQERRYGEQSFHWLDPYLAAPPAHRVAQVRLKSDFLVRGARQP